VAARDLEVKRNFFLCAEPIKPSLAAMGDELNAVLRKYFSADAVVDHYLRAAGAVGLWQSEEVLCERWFRREDTLLEVGCGAGRIALGLHELGFRHVLGVDLSREMVEAARKAAQSLDYGVSFQVADACRLPFEEGLFEGAIFGFNGLMQIPGRDRRRAALREIRRVVVGGGHFLFTTHDRDHPLYRSFWEAEAKRWEDGSRDARLGEYGDRLVPEDRGELYIHVPTVEAMREDLLATGWGEVFTALRGEIANESARVREFADECRFWVVRKVPLNP
jgi:SAM-dependent methyltransferase